MKRKRNSIISESKGPAFRWYYYDVWGNKKDGWEVNNVFRSNDVINIPKGLGIRTLTVHLKNIGFFKKSVKNNLIDYDGDEYTIFITYKGKPEGELRAE